MNKATRITALIVALLPAALTVSAADYYSSEFSTISAAFTLKDADDAAIDANSYSHLQLEKPWEAGRIDSKGFVALCPTHSGTDTPQENWLIAPSISVTSDEACVVWKARSIHPDLKESYKVMVSVDDAEEFTEIFSIQEEQTAWITRLVSLADYVGHNVKVAFLCTSVNKFMLAIDDLKIGVPRDTELYVTDRTSHFVSNSEIENGFHVNFTVTNVGKSITGGKIYVADYDENGLPQEFELSTPFNSGETINIDATLPAHQSNVYNYLVSFEDDQENASTLLLDKIMCGDFTRKILIDEGTATWCNNCPVGTIAVEELQQKYGDNIIPVCTHTGDVMVNAEYFTALGYYDIPKFMVNRNSETVSSSLSIDSELEKPAKFGINATAELTGATINLIYDITASENFDNSSDRYRLGYVFLRDYAMGADDGKYLQKNSATQPSWDRFYYMPTYISPTMNTFRNVSVGATAAFTGIANSLPAEINAWDTHYAECDIDVPSQIEGLDGNLVVFLLDTETGYVHNAEIATLGVPNSIKAPREDSTIRYSMSGKLCRLSLNEGESYTVRIYSTDGKLLLVQNRNIPTIDFSRYEGPIIMKVTTDTSTITAKILL